MHLNGFRKFAFMCAKGRLVLSHETPEIRMGQYRDNDHREHAHHFTFSVVDMEPVELTFGRFLRKDFKN